MSREILVLGLNPAWQRVFFLDKFTPGEVHRISKVKEYASGKGINCCRVLQLLGGTPRLMHFLGAGNGEKIFDELSACGIQQVPIWIRENTRICTTIACNGDTTELVEPSPMLADSENEDFAQTLNDYWDSTQYIALCGTFPQGFNAKMFNELDFSDKHIFVDAIDGIDELLAK